jgi:hypothetical protein
MRSPLKLLFVLAFAAGCSAGSAARLQNMTAANVSLHIELSGRAGNWNLDLKPGQHRVIYLRPTTDSHLMITRLDRPDDPDVSKPQVVGYFEAHYSPAECVQILDRAIKLVRCEEHIGLCDSDSLFCPVDAIRHAREVVGTD